MTATITSEAKTFVTLQARAALQGVILHQCHDDRDRPVYIVSRWNLTRELHSLEEVDRWIARLEGKA